MLPTFPDDQNRNAAVFLMTTLSPRAAESIDKELYRASADSDAADSQYIMEHCFVEMIKDLEEIGLIIDLDYSRFTQDSVELLKFLQLAQLLLPNHLYPLMATDRKIRTVIEDIVMGNLGDADDTAIETYLSQIGGLDDLIPLYPDLEEFIQSIFPSISQTVVFSNYLRYQVELLGEESLMPASDQEAHLKYNAKIKEIISRLLEALALFETSEVLESITQLFIQDLSAAANFHDYAYLFLETKDSLPEELASGFERKWYYYWISHRWCAQYYPLRKMDNPLNILPMLLSVPYAFLEQESEYIKHIASFHEITRDPANPNCDGRILALYRR
jgi:hypothetical protein